MFLHITDMNCLIIYNKSAVLYKLLIKYWVGKMTEHFKDYSCSDMTQWVSVVWARCLESTLWQLKACVESKANAQP
jgi:hypothetical protein